MNRTDITQYRVSFSNAPRAGALLARVLEKEKIDPRNVKTARCGERIAVQFLAPKSDKLRGALEKTGASVCEDQVFQLELPNRPSELHRLAKALEDAGIRILSLYSAVEKDRIRMVLAVDDPANAVALAEKLGFDPDYYVFEL
jgi:hypothetical protein